MSTARDTATQGDVHAAEGVSVVIPCLNEADSIEDVVGAAQAGLASLSVPFEVIVVDNGSTDRSAAVARDAGARVLREARRGYGSALRKGFSEARYEIMAMADGDLTYDLTRLEDIVGPLLRGDADMVVGNRMDNIHPGAMPMLHRHIGNPLLSFLLRVMFHRHDIRDAHCGLRAVTKRAYRELHCITTGMEFASEMIIKAIRADLRIAQCDIEYHPRTGESKLRTFRDGWRHMRFMLLHSPSVVLLLPGTFFWAISLILSLPFVVGPVIVSARQFDIHFMLILGVINIASMQVMTAGLLAKAYAHLSGIRRDPVVAWLYERLSFESGAVFSGLLLLIGLVFVGYVVGRWTTGGFGALDQARPLFFGVLCVVNGIQLGACSYLFSIMALPRHLDTLSDEEQQTAISDL